tara:strand:- start:346 stop:666 length:321 start_codon:yes stop_codon:yes gene_type:complete
MMMVGGLGGGGTAVASLLKSEDATAAMQPEVQRTIERMDREMTYLRDRDKLLDDRLKASDAESKRRYQRVTRDLEGIDQDLVEVGRLVSDLCRSDRACRRRNNLDD